MRVEVRPRPDLAAAPPWGAPPPPRRAPHVLVLPYLAEQGRRGEQGAPDERAGAVLPTLRRLFKDATFEALSDDAAANVSSDFHRFLTGAWPRLGRLNVLVTHGNFLKNEVLRPAGILSGPLANASVVEVEVARGADRKRLLLVRHCLSHHNASRRGSASWTTCASVAALRRLAARLAQELGETDVVYGSSFLPRAAMSCLALQRDVSPRELELAAAAFRADRASPEEVRTCGARQGCGGRRGDGFCDARRGSFEL